MYVNQTLGSEHYTYTFFYKQLVLQMIIWTVICIKLTTLSCRPCIGLRGVTGNFNHIFRTQNLHLLIQDVRFSPQLKAMWYNSGSLTWSWQICTTGINKSLFLHFRDYLPTTVCIHAPSHSFSKNELMLSLEISDLFNICCYREIKK